MNFAGFVGPSYIGKSPNISMEEAINIFLETNETPGAQAQRSYLWTPGLKLFSALPGDDGPTRGGCNTGTRVFQVSGTSLVELASDGTYTVRASVASDSTPAIIAFSTIELLITSAGQAYCYNLAANTITNVTTLLAGTPSYVQYADGYFIVSFYGSNKFQVSAPLDGNTWPGLQVNEVTVFPESIRSIIVNHRELWVMGERHIQPYTNTGSDSIYEPIPGALIEKGSACTFGMIRADNTVLWVDEDERGGRSCWRANGYTPQRVSTHAVEWALEALADVSNLVSYSYQQGGHVFWMLYIPGTGFSWCYDIAEQTWHKRAEWHAASGTYGPHRSWNYTYAFGKHLVGDWQTGNLYEMSLDYLDDFGETIRRVRQAPTLHSELKRLFFSELRINFQTGIGPQPPLTDGEGNPRPPQAMLQWSNDGGNTWGNEHWKNCGFAGQYGTFVRWTKMGYARRRVYRLVMSDPIAWSITDASYDATAEA